MPVTPLLLAGIAGAVCVAGCIQGILGFGFGLVSMALLSWMLGVKGAVPVVATLALVVNSTLSVRFREAFSLRDAAPLLGAAVCGIPLGVYVLRSWPADRLMIVLGMLVLGYVVWGLSKTTVPPLGAAAGAALGLVAGVLGGAFSSAGPPAVVWVSSQPWPSRQLRATLVSLFAVGGALQVALLTHGGMVTLDTVKIVALAIPAAGLGSLMGANLGDRVPQDQFRRIMLGGLGVLALVIISSGVRGG